MIDVEVGPTQPRRLRQWSEDGMNASIERADLGDDARGDAFELGDVAGKISGLRTAKLLIELRTGTDPLRPR